MTVALTETYISTVDKSRTITLPDTVPVGAKVAIVLLPPEDEPGVRASREARFAEVMETIGAAQAAGFVPPAVSDAELDARIERARRSAVAWQETDQSTNSSSSILKLPN